MAPLSQSGFSLVEALAAIVVLGLVAMAILPVFSVQLDANTRNEIRAGAVAATQVRLEGLRSIDPSEMRATGRDPEAFHDVGKRRYSILTHYCLRPEFCTEQSRHLFIEVFLEGRKIYDVETVQTQLL